jgi:hypothetical protein
MLALCIFPFGKSEVTKDMLKGMSSLKVLTPLCIPQQHLATVLYLCQDDNMPLSRPDDALLNIDIRLMIVSYLPSPRSRD